MNHKELASKIARDLMTGWDDGVMGARLKLFDGAGEYMGGWSLDGITNRIEQLLEENLDDLDLPHTGTCHPPHEWIRLAADREDQCESISAGGLAADLGMVQTELERFTQHVDRLFVKPVDQIDRLVHAAVGIAGEAGEILDTVKRTWVYGQPLNRENLLEESGDVLFYVAGLLIHSGYTMQMAMDHNKAKLAQRYPNGYTDEAATIRADKNDG